MALMCPDQSKKDEFVEDPACLPVESCYSSKIRSTKLQNSYFDYLNYQTDPK
jgi:hypothetical protein